MVEYPYFLGHADERGAGTGEGFNLNLPLPHGTDFAGWSEALATGCAAVAGFAPGGARGLARRRHLSAATRSASSASTPRTTR